MFNWLWGKKDKHLADKTKKGFEEVRKDFSRVGLWVKHLDKKDKQLFEAFDELKLEISSIKDELEGLHETMGELNFEQANRQLLKKTAVWNKQTAVEPVQEYVQTPVQTGNFYDILKGLSANERLVVFALMNAGEGMKLSYEDLARLLGKERSTIRGQINAIKQKSEGLILELTEPSGKKRVYVSEEVRNKLLKYAKVRVRKERKLEDVGDSEEKEEELETNHDDEETHVDEK